MNTTNRWMNGTMDEADFEEGTLTFKMSGEYWAVPGMYAIVPVELLEKMLAERFAAPRSDKESA